MQPKMRCVWRFQHQRNFWWKLAQTGANFSAGPPSDSKPSSAAYCSDVDISALTWCSQPSPSQSKLHDNLPQKLAALQNIVTLRHNFTSMLISPSLPPAIRGTSQWEAIYYLLCSQSCQHVLALRLAPCLPQVALAIDCPESGLSLLAFLEGVSAWDGLMALVEAELRHGHVDVGPQDGRWSSPTTGMRQVKVTLRLLLHSSLDIGRPLNRSWSLQAGCVYGCSGGGVGGSEHPLPLSETSDCPARACLREKRNDNAWVSWPGLLSSYVANDTDAQSSKI